MKLNISLSAAALALLIACTSCTKEAASSNNNTDSTSNELTIHADDQSRVSVETDNITNETTLAIESTAGFSGNALNIVPTICDATISFDTTGTTKKITITYKGTNCSGARIRTGAIVLSMAKGVYWKTAGAELTITYQNLKITRMRDNKSITLNGSHIITNVSGGLLLNLATLKTITHTISSNALSITFDDNSTRNWQVAEKRVFTYGNGAVITITGNHTEGNNNAIALWGSNRFGHSFTTSITQPLVIKQACDFRLTSGVVTHAGFGTATATYGLDKDGNPTSCPSTGSYFCKISWTGPAGHTVSSLFEY